MSAIKTLKDALFGTDDMEEYHYECEICHAQFTSEEPTVQTVACPQCGAHSVRERTSTDG